LQTTEGRYAEIVRLIEASRFNLLGGHKIFLRHFCQLQYMRTESILNQSFMMMNEIASVAYGDELPPGGGMSMAEAVQMGMKAFADTQGALSDLKACLIANHTATPFVTSDNPCVYVNRLYVDDERVHFRSPGLGSSGTAFFLPMTPTVLCLLYDGDVYSLAHDAGWIGLRNDADVAAFNEQQLLNCSANVYFADWQHLQLVKKAFESCADRRPAERYEVIVAPLESENEFGQSFRVVPRSELEREGKALIHVKGIRVAPSRWPSVLRWRTSQRIYSNDSGTGFLRKGSLSRGLLTGSGYRNVARR
jgi:Protein of unknown function (DUF4238)